MKNQLTPFNPTHHNPEESDNTNGQRAEAGAHAVIKHDHFINNIERKPFVQSKHNLQDDEDIFVDTLTNILHAAHAYGHTPDRLIDTALSHWIHESGNQDYQPCLQGIHQINVHILSVTCNDENLNSIRTFLDTDQGHAELSYHLGLEIRQDVHDGTITKRTSNKFKSLVAQRRYKEACAYYNKALDKAELYTYRLHYHMHSEVNGRQLSEPSTLNS